MQPMAIDNSRRELLKGALFATMAPLYLSGCSISNNAQSQDNGESLLVGCAALGNDEFIATAVQIDGSPVWQCPLPHRGHGVAINAELNQVAIFGRRPGEFIKVVDGQSGQQVAFIPQLVGRHFYGHGAYSNSGQFLYVTEGISETSEGVIGVYDAFNGYQRVNEFSGIGIGPHEIIVRSDDTIVVAVGGIQTSGRTKLNLDTMQPKLVYIRPDGEIVSQLGLGSHLLSIRHIACDESGAVVCGQQYQGDEDDSQPLMAISYHGQSLLLLEATPEEWMRFNSYIGSVAMVGEHIVATSPRGNCYGVWDKTTRKLVKLGKLTDASGVVAMRPSNTIQFAMSSGIGEMKLIPSIRQDSISTLTSSTSIAWDNHLSYLQI